MEEEELLGEDDDLDDFIDYGADKDNNKGNDANKKIKYNRYYEEEEDAKDAKYDGDLMKALGNMKPDPIKAKPKDKGEINKEKAKESEDLMRDLFANDDEEKQEEEEAQVQQRFQYPAQNPQMEFFQQQQQTGRMMMNYQQDYMMGNLTGYDGTNNNNQKQQSSGRRVVADEKMLEDDDEIVIDESVMAKYHVDLEKNRQQKANVEEVRHNQQQTRQVNQAQVGGRNPSGFQQQQQTSNTNAAGGIALGPKIYQSKVDMNSLYIKKPECQKELIQKTQTNLSAISEPPKQYNLGDNDLEFYWLDAVEDYKNKSRIHLFGKVRHPGQSDKQKKIDYFSGNLQIKNMKRNIFVFKKEDSTASLEEMQEEIEGRIKFKHSYIYNKMKMKPCKKYYAFEMNVQHGEVECIKISYSFDFPTLDIPFEGKTYKGIFGTTYTPIEMFMLKRKIMGPCWLKVQNVEEVRDRESYCSYEFFVDTYKDMIVHEDAKKPAPPLKALFVSMEMIQPPAGSANKKSQIATIAGLFCERYNIEYSDACTYQPSLFVQAKNIDKSAQQTLVQNFGESINIVDKEYGILTSFIQKLNKLDPDLIIGHDLNQVFMDNQLSHAVDNKIEFTSQLSRLKRRMEIMKSLLRLPKNQKTRAFTYGRLLCDTFLCSKELIRESDYSLKYISNKQLNITYENHEEDATLSPYESLVRRLDASIRDAHLSARIASKLQIIQLTKQLTNVAGCLWTKSQQNARAERNEMLLMHMFWRKGYVLPDKQGYNDFTSGGDDEEKGAKGKAKKNKRNKFVGGLVFEPISGLYDDIVQLLDFNSLYPSIIREYKICFTTVQRAYVEIDEVKPEAKSTVRYEPKGNNKNAIDENKEEEEEEDKDNDDYWLSKHDAKMIPDGDKKTCILPEIIKSLIDRRKQVKNMIKDEKNLEKLELLDIRQKAYKLIANSIYGCLGFTFSRFYAKTMAALVTSFGRSLLKGSSEKVKNMGYEVIYGDTDSLMINSRQKDTWKALEVGTQIKKEINIAFKSRILEIEIDGVFKCQLLLKKKKYAAMKIDNFGEILNSGGQHIEEKLSKEVKGLDVVRRDWCILSKEVGNRLLELILSQRPRDDIISDIYLYMDDLGLKFKSLNIDIDKFVIYKQLNKLPHEYPANSQPHANVAKRMKQKLNISDEQLLHHFIAYVICQGTSSSYAERAYSVDEVKDSKKQKAGPDVEILNPDYAWYANNQIVNPVARLLEYIDGIDMGRIAKAIGIDTNKFQSKA